MKLTNKLWNSAVFEQADGTQECLVVQPSFWFANDFHPQYQSLRVGNHYFLATNRLHNKNFNLLHATSARAPMSERGQIVQAPMIDSPWAHVGPKVFGTRLKPPILKALSMATMVTGVIMMSSTANCQKAECGDESVDWWN